MWSQTVSSKEESIHLPSDISGDSQNVGSSLDPRLFRYGSIRAEDVEALKRIFDDSEEKQNFPEESVLRELLRQRIPITEFLSLLVSDSSWSHVANKSQTLSVFELFDKVYGYVRGRTRLDEQNARYQRRI
jgi:hypothetical protein